MLSISTIPEALAELEKQTGRAWTDSELFDVATKHGIKLHAAAPITAKLIIQKFVAGEGFKEKPRAETVYLALLYPWQIGQLWISGETLTISPDDTNLREPEEDEYLSLQEPIRVTRETVRIRADTLRRILKIWENAQAGRWIKDKSSPDGMRRQIGPDWMFPQPLEAPVETPVARSEVVKRGITKQRIISAFEGLYFHTSAQWNRALTNVPDWLEPSIVMRGKPGNNKQSTLWNPVGIAIALSENGISINKLDSVFVGLAIGRMNGEKNRNTSVKLISDTYRSIIPDTYRTATRKPA
jgi:hypothetical protein